MQAISLFLPALFRTLYLTTLNFSGTRQRGKKVVCELFFQGSTNTLKTYHHQSRPTALQAVVHSVGIFRCSTPYLVIL